MFKTFIYIVICITCFQSHAQLKISGKTKLPDGTPFLITKKIHGEYIPVNAEVSLISNLSAHGDYLEILDWLRGFESAPKRVFVTHGEPIAADAMRHHIEEALHWNTCVPDYLETVELN